MPIHLLLSRTAAERFGSRIATVLEGHDHRSSTTTTWGAHVVNVARGEAVVEDSTGREGRALRNTAST